MKKTYWKLDGVLADHPAHSMAEVVAYNVIRAREARGMTQEQLGDKLRAITGRPWPRTAVTMAENTWSGDPARRRKFDVNQVAALAIALQVPIGWFFMPPAPEEEDGRSYVDPWFTCGSEAKEAYGADYMRWLALARFDEDDPADLMTKRLRDEAPQFSALEAVEKSLTREQL